MTQSHYNPSRLCCVEVKLLAYDRKQDTVSPRIETQSNDTLSFQSYTLHNDAAVLIDRITKYSYANRAGYHFTETLNVIIPEGRNHHITVFFCFHCTYNCCFFKGRSTMHHSHDPKYTLTQMHTRPKRIQKLPIGCCLTLSNSFFSRSQTLWNSPSFGSSFLPFFVPFVSWNVVFL
jgi:hypothetical protein